ncbi:uncharacterized protein N7459_002996 [Penicillium hispanicum]|uniref:uncharacterized protein n=1 Tax=Penicillium hispanicum TaxID=1080232 RepID=UPI0025423DB9|nr:uncharacterized protein N7459_002996 [Penicillium hispanicum]KAJ5587231.1 hypothetical protein N7459_002996 [Penicillium hispanicum]
MLRLLICIVALILAQIVHSAHHSDSLRHRVVDLSPFRLTSRAQYVSANQVVTNIASSVPPKEQNYLETATQLVQTIVPEATFRVVDDHYVGDNGVAHVNFRQTIHGIDIGNADFNVNVGKDGKIFSYGNSFYTCDVPETDPWVQRNFSNPEAALRSSLDILKLLVTVDNISTETTGDKESYVFRGIYGVESNPTAKLVYFVKSDGNLALCWMVETDVGDHWLLTYVDANDNKIHGVVDYVAEASYEVYKWGLGNPTEGSRIVVDDPWDTSASPFTWIGDGNANYTTTRGNNGIAQFIPFGEEPYLNNFRPSSPELQFEYPYSSSMSPPTSYINASIVQLFYTANTYHDLLYILGFDEKAGNFQWNNNGKGGLGQDYVILDAQDERDINDASFASPADGLPGRMRVGIWTQSTPYRDGSFDSGLVIHEYTHGLSSRLTGGPANPGCLYGLDSAGMGEGWSDFMATLIRLKPNDTRTKDYPIAEWASNQPGGIRNYPYSTSLATNPLTYTSVNSLDDVHDVGTVWASMLYEVMWNPIDKHGKNDSPKPTFRNAVPTDGKYLTMKLVMDGMALQPCTPSFLQARDAILDADTALTGGANHCDIWKGFAKRGLGQGATYSTTDRGGSTVVPLGIC